MKWLQSWILPFPLMPILSFSRLTPQVSRSQKRWKKNFTIKKDQFKRQKICDCMTHTFSERSSMTSAATFCPSVSFFPLVEDRSAFFLFVPVAAASAYVFWLFDIYLFEGGRITFGRIPSFLLFWTSWIWKVELEQHMARHAAVLDICPHTDLVFQRNCHKSDTQMMKEK